MYHGAGSGRRDTGNMTKPMFTEQSPEYVSPALIALVAKHAPAELDLFNHLLRSIPIGTSKSLETEKSPKKVVESPTATRADVKAPPRSTRRSSFTKDMKEMNRRLDALSPRPNETRPGQSAPASHKPGSPVMSGRKAPVVPMKKDPSTRKDMPTSVSKTTKTELPGVSTSAVVSKDELQRPSTASPRSNFSRPSVARPSTASPSRPVTAPPKKEGSTVKKVRDPSAAYKEKSWTTLKNDLQALANRKELPSSEARRNYLTSIYTPGSCTKKPLVTAKVANGSSETQKETAASPESELSRDTPQSFSNSPTGWTTALHAKPTVREERPNISEADKRISAKSLDLRRQEKHHEGHIHDGQDSKTLKLTRKRPSQSEVPKTTNVYKERVKQFDEKRRSKMRPVKPSVKEQRPPWEFDMAGMSFDGVGPWFGSPATRQQELGLPVIVEDMIAPKIVELELENPIRSYEFGSPVRCSIVELPPAAICEIPGRTANRRREPVIKKASWKTGVHVSRRSRKSLSSLGLFPRSKKQAKEGRNKNIQKSSPLWFSKRDGRLTDARRKPPRRPAALQSQRRSTTLSMKKRAPWTPSDGLNGQKRKQKEKPVTRRKVLPKEETEYINKLRKSTEQRAEQRTYLPLIKDLAQQLVSRVDAACISSILNEGTVEICLQRNTAMLSEISEIDPSPPVVYEDKTLPSCEDDIFFGAFLHHAKEKLDLTESEQAGTTETDNRQRDEVVQEAEENEQKEADLEESDQMGVDQEGPREAVHEKYLPPTGESIESTSSKLSRSSPDIFQIKLPNVQRLKREKRDEIHGPPNKLLKEEWKLPTTADPLSVINVYTKYRLKEQFAPCGEEVSKAVPNNPAWSAEELTSRQLKTPETVRVNMDKNDARESADDIVTSSSISHASKRLYKRATVSLWRRLSVEVKKLKRIRKAWWKHAYSPVDLEAEGTDALFRRNLRTKASAAGDSFLGEKFSLESSPESNGPSRQTANLDMKTKELESYSFDRPIRRRRRRMVSSINQEALKVDWLEKNLVRKRKEAQHWRLRWKRHALEAELKKLDAEIYETRSRIEQNMFFQTQAETACQEFPVQKSFAQPTLRPSSRTSFYKDPFDKAVKEGSESAVDTTNYSESFVSEPDEREPDVRQVGEPGTEQEVPAFRLVLPVNRLPEKGFQPLIRRSHDTTASYKELALSEELSFEPHTVASGEHETVQTVSEEDFGEHNEEVEDLDGKGNEDEESDTTCKEEEVEDADAKGIEDEEFDTVRKEEEGEDLDAKGNEDEEVDTVRKEEEVEDPGNDAKENEKEEVDRICEEDLGLSLSHPKLEAEFTEEEEPDEAGNLAPSEEDESVHDSIVNSSTKEEDAPVNETTRNAILEEAEAEITGGSGKIVTTKEDDTWSVKESIARTYEDDNRSVKSDASEVYSEGAFLADEEGAIEGEAQMKTWAEFQLTLPQQTQLAEYSDDKESMKELAEVTGEDGGSFDHLDNVSVFENPTFTEKRTTEAQEDTDRTHATDETSTLDSRREFFHLPERVSHVELCPKNDELDEETASSSLSGTPSCSGDEAEEVNAQVANDINGREEQNGKNSDKEDREEQNDLNSEKKEAPGGAEGGSDHYPETDEESRSEQPGVGESELGPGGSGASHGGVALELITHQTTEPMVKSEQSPRSIVQSPRSSIVSPRNLSESKRQMLEELLNIEEDDIPEEIFVDERGSTSTDDKADLTSEGYEQDISCIQAAFDSLQNEEEAKAKAEFVTLSKAYSERSSLQVEKAEESLDVELQQIEKHQMNVANVLFASILQVDSGVAHVPAPSNLPMQTKFGLAKVDTSRPSFKQQQRGDFNKRLAKRTLSPELRPKPSPSISQEYVQAYVTEFLKLVSSTGSSFSLLERSMQQHPSYNECSVYNKNLFDCVSEFMARSKLEASLMPKAELVEVITAKLMSFLERPRLLELSSLQQEDAPEEDISIATELCDKLLTELVEEFLREEGV